MIWWLVYWPHDYDRVQTWSTHIQLSLTVTESCDIAMKNRQSALTSLGTFLKQMWPFRQAPKIEVHACLLWNQAPKWHLKYITFDPMPICNCQGQAQSTRRFPTSNFVGTTTDALLDPPLLVASASRSQRMAHGQAQIQGVCHWPSHHQMHQQVQGSLNQCQQLVSANKWTDLANKVMQTKWCWQSKHGRPCTLDSTLTLTPAAPAITLTPLWLWLSVWLWLNWHWTLMELVRAGYLRNNRH